MVRPREARPTLEKAGKQARARDSGVGGGYPALSILTLYLELLWQAEGEVDLDRRAYAGECVSSEQSCCAWTPTGLGSRGCVLGAGQLTVPSCQSLSPSVGLRGHAAADPGCHGDRLLYPMDAGDFRGGRGGS